MSIGCESGVYQRKGIGAKKNLLLQEIGAKKKLLLQGERNWRYLPVQNRLRISSQEVSTCSRAIAPSGGG